MRAFKKAEANAKLASRRFSKGIVCRIIKGARVIDFIVSSNLVPQGLIFPDIEIAYASNRNRVFVVPLYNYEEFEQLIGEAGLSLRLGQSQNPAPTPPNNEKQNAFQLQKELRRQEPLLNFLKQNMIMVAINPLTIPKNLPANIKKVDVLVDSIDTSQAINGEFVYTTTTYTNEYKDWRQ
jgi:hypothetical protein